MVMPKSSGRPELPCVARCSIRDRRWPGSSCCRAFRKAARRARPGLHLAGGHGPPDADRRDPHSREPCSPNGREFRPSVSRGRRDRRDLGQRPRHAPRRECDRRRRPNRGRRGLPSDRPGSSRPTGSMSPCSHWMSEGAWVAMSVLFVLAVPRSSTDLPRQASVAAAVGGVLYGVTFFDRHGRRRDDAPGHRGLGAPRRVGHRGHASRARAPPGRDVLPGRGDHDVRRVRRVGRPERRNAPRSHSRRAVQLSDSPADSGPVEDDADHRGFAGGQPLQRRPDLDGRQHVGDQSTQRQPAARGLPQDPLPVRGARREVRRRRARRRPDPTRRR